MRWFIRQNITGCEENEAEQSTYMTRWIIFECSFGKLMLHRFYRSDHDELHDHPWNFHTLVLWGGYNEIQACASCMFHGMNPTMCVNKVVLRTYPLHLYYRPAETAHRVELIDGKQAWTLVWASKRVRNWGFWRRVEGWVFWKQYFDEKKCDTVDDYKSKEEQPILRP